jgi:hypothetical protein
VSAVHDRLDKVPRVDVDIALDESGHDLVNAKFTDDR